MLSKVTRNIGLLQKVSHLQPLPLGCFFTWSDGITNLGQLDIAVTNLFISQRVRMNQAIRAFSTGLKPSSGGVNE